MVDDSSRRPLVRPSPRPEKPRLGWLSLGLAGMGLAGTCVILIFLTLGVFGPVLLIGAAMLLLVVLHFVVWGWWLGRIIHEDESGSTTNDEKPNDGGKTKHE